MATRTVRLPFGVRLYLGDVVFATRESGSGERPIKPLGFFGLAKRGGRWQVWTDTARDYGSWPYRLASAWNHRGGNP
jgi:hypothetical protein